MYALLVTTHVLVCFLMIASILLQAGKGAEIGASFGGSSQTVFGSRGPGTFLSKVTIAAAVIFMVTSLSLAVLSRERTFSSTVIDLNKTESAPAATPHNGEAGHDVPVVPVTPPPAPPPDPAK